MSKCGLSDLVVEFPTTGARIKAYSADYKVRTGRLEYSKLEVSRDAGELIASIVEADPIPAVLSINGRNLCRLMADEDSVSHVGDISWIALRDPRAILKNGHIEWEPEKATLGEAVEYVYARVQDPNGVISGVNIIGREERYRADREFTRELDRQMDRTVPEFLRGITNPFTGDPILAIERMKAGFRFIDLTPGEAFQELTDIFQLDSWITAGGTLAFGPEGGQASVGFVGEELGDLRLMDHHIVEKAVPFSAVAVRGNYRDMWTDEGFVLYKPKLEQFQANTVATFNSPSRSRRAYLDSRNIDSIEELEQIATNALRKSIRESASGSLEINSAESGIGGLRPEDLDLGDVLVVPKIDRDCHKQVREGAYSVTGLNHRIGPSEGWTTSVDVSRFVSPDDIEVYTEVAAIGSDDWFDADEYSEGMFGPDYAI